mmetsp:Transcript_15916/g.19742  ORF Transcript_15916/g.19742 Transcript_15916/m.19742 type:complete len:164 (+) Transcript_15916:330-821(+)
MEEPPPYFMTPGKPHKARGDWLLWLSRNHPYLLSPPLSLLLAKYEAIQHELASTAIKLQGEQESQMAYYAESGIGYRRHRDTIPDDGSEPSDARRITAITYCNPDWQPTHGGELRLWLSRHDGYEVIELDPKPGRLLIFLSGLLDHEVRPSFSPRVAVTTWFW